VALFQPAGDLFRAGHSLDLQPPRPPSALLSSPLVFLSWDYFAWMKITPEYSPPRLFGSKT